VHREFRAGKDVCTAVKAAEWIEVFEIQRTTPLGNLRQHCCSREAIGAVRCTPRAIRFVLATRLSRPRRDAILWVGTRIAKNASAFAGHLHSRHTGERLIGTPEATDVFDCAQPTSSNCATSLESVRPSRSWTAAVSAVPLWFQVIQWDRKTRRPFVMLRRQLADRINR